MRLTTFILIASLVQVSAASLAQRITLSQNKASLKQIFAEIKKQTGYDVFYQAGKVKEDQVINTNFSNTPLEKVMEQCLEGQPLTFTIDEKTVLIKEKNPSFLERVASYFASIDVRGRVVDEQGRPLVGATVRVKASTGTSGGMDKITKTNAKGEFFLNDVDENATIQIVFIGYKTKELKVSGDLGSIKLEESVGELAQVDVTYNTGYQKVDPTKATGSFVQIDSALFNRRVGSTVLDRLDGVTNGLIFNKNILGGRNQSEISIRSRSTIFSNPNPLIVLDDFPYEGDFNNINPDDIASVTVLKDAAAASIWGARSGNGVIVITTKKGSYNQKQKITINTSIVRTEKPDLYYMPQISVNDYIEVEKFLFDNGAFASAINTGYSYVSPAVEIFNRQRLGLITSDEAEVKLAELSSNDIRKDINRIINTNPVNQRYALNIIGGGARNQYYFSAGYDKNNGISRNNNSDRITISGRSTYSIVEDKLELSTDIVLTKSVSHATTNPTIFHPYTKLIDEKGFFLPTGGFLRQAYIDTAGGGKLLNWNYSPIEEPDYISFKTDLVDYQLKSALKYKIYRGLMLSVLYQHSRGMLENDNLYMQESFFTRDLINRYTQIDQLTGAITNILPLGDILDHRTSKYYSNNLRGQFSYERKFSNSEILILAGLESRTTNRLAIADDRLYGYNANLQSNTRVNFDDLYPYFYNSTITSRIPNASPGRAEFIDNNRSYFGNISYSFLERYSFSASIRKDESNIFGVDANQKGVPLWSVGAAYNLSREPFYAINWLPILKLRLTHGYNGNFNKSIGAYTITRAGGANIYNTQVLSIDSPPNPDLRWERVKMINFGVDFAAKNNGISGSIEYFMKDGQDLIGSTQVAAQTGITSFTGNAANIQGRGLDVTINSINLNKSVIWRSVLLVSYAADKVTGYKFTPPAVSQYMIASSITPAVGKPVYAVFSYRFAGLDPNNGDPIGYFNNQLSKNYSSIAGSKDVNTLRYHGPATPKIFGSFRNTIGFKNIELSTNITYKLGYYFRRHSLSYIALLSTNLTTTDRGFNPDYKARWREPGDELRTNVPALKYPGISNLNSFYANSEVLVEKGDHIRLQDIQLSYTLPKGIKTLGINNFQVYLYANNLGILWRENKYRIDPDFVPGSFSVIYPNPISLAIGVNINFK